MHANPMWENVTWVPTDLVTINNNSFSFDKRAPDNNVTFSWT